MARVIAPVRTPEDLLALKQLWREYWTSTGLEDRFQGFAEELDSLPGAYSEPRGLLLIAKIDDEPAGCGSLRPLSSDVCEAKRMFVRPQFRGAGLGRALLRSLIQHATSLGYATMCADTFPSMTEALNLYESFGFERTGPYSESATVGAVYLRKDV